MYHSANLSSGGPSMISLYHKLAVAYCVHALCTSLLFITHLLSYPFYFFASILQPQIAGNSLGPCRQTLFIVPFLVLSFFRTFKSLFGQRRKPKDTRQAQVEFEIWKRGKQSSASSAIRMKQGGRGFSRLDVSLT